MDGRTCFQVAGRGGGMTSDFTCRGCGRAENNFLLVSLYFFSKIGEGGGGLKPLAPPSLLLLNV